MARLKSLFHVTVGFFAALGVLSVTQGNLAHASIGAVTPANLVAVVNTLQGQVAALQQKTAPLAVTGTPGTSPATLTISGVNVQIVSGSGYTDDGTSGEVNGAALTGLGNLIIGYNGTRGTDAKGNSLDAHTGSHNLVLGDGSNYTSYGGLVAGNNNTISGTYCSVTGGRSNTASSYVASVSGGGFSTASGVESSVSGGEAGTASGYAGSISGGKLNLASGTIASVTGGQGNTASGSYASTVSGGLGIVDNNYVGWGAGGFFSPKAGPGVFHSP